MQLLRNSLNDDATIQLLKKTYYGRSPATLPTDYKFLSSVFTYNKIWREKFIGPDRVRKLFMIAIDVATISVNTAIPIDIHKSIILPGTRIRSDQSKSKW